MMDLQVIERLGRWQMDALHKSYLRFFKPEGLLVLAGWREAAQKDYDKFWSERFCLDIPSVLVEFVFPFLPTLISEVAEMGEAATTSMRSVPQVLQYLAVVLVQDACELASHWRAHPVYAYLLQHEAFRCAWHSARPLLGALTCKLLITLWLRGVLQGSWSVPISRKRQQVGLRSTGHAAQGKRWP
jgi:hypothetical protein